jgi:hypothetical protein
MCDYSLYAVPNRLVVEGEQLVVHRFPMGSLGMASVADVRRIEVAQTVAPKMTWWEKFKSCFEDEPATSKVCAVCVPPGAHLILKSIPRALQQRFGLQEEEGVVFTQISADVNSYRDAVRFNNGVQIRLQELQVGQLVEVLSLAGARTELFERELQVR